MTTNILEKEKNTSAKANSAKPGGLAVAALAAGAKLAGGLLKIKGVASFLSMLLSVIAYWWTARLGLSGALLFVALLFAHEMGHLLVARRQGLDTSLPLFIPFVGALISLKEMPKDVENEAWMALGGPILGSIAALACLPVFLLTGDKLWLWGASIGFMLNLFNLLPASPLDGGRIIGAIWRGFWVLGAGTLLGLAMLWHDIFLLVIFVIAAAEIEERYWQFDSRWWLYGAGVSVGIAVLWANWLVLFLTGLLALNFWGRRLHAKREKQRREFLQLMLQRINTILAGNDEELSQPKYRANFLAARADIEGQLNPPQVADDYFKIEPAKRFLIGAVYVGLAAGLSAAMLWIHSLNVFV